MNRVLVTTWRRQGRVFGPPLRDMFGAEVQYVQAVQRAGLQAYLAPHPGDVAGTPDADDVLLGFDGLVVIGGEDVAAEVSGVPPETVGANADPDRDRWEIALLRAALRADLAILPVCRGLQLLNVALGGTLHGHVSGTSAQHPPVPEDTAESLAYRHDVRVTLGSRLARILGTTTIRTNSLHHQSVARTGEGLVPVAHTADGGIEAVELPGARWCVGVQWHPELMPGDPVQERLLAGFAAACRGLSPSGDPLVQPSGTTPQQRVSRR